MFVPVVDSTQKPLMPTKPSRARRWIQQGKATPFWKNGVFCVRLNVDPSDTETQEIVVGVDPGSKKEGFTVKSESHTYLNVQADAHNKVAKKIEKRRILRRGRRSRKCPNRKNRMDRLANKVRVPAGTRARWDWKLRILDWKPSKMFPICQVCRGHQNIKYGLACISGFGKTGISLYSLEGKRLCQDAKQTDFRVLRRLNFNYRSGLSTQS